MEHGALVPVLALAMCSFVYLIYSAILDNRPFNLSGMNKLKVAKVIH